MIAMNKFKSKHLLILERDFMNVKMNFFKEVLNKQ